MDVNKGCLPSPEDLKYKILIKAKRSKKVDKEEKDKDKEEKTDREGKSDAEQENPPSETGFKASFEETMKLARRISVVISRAASPDKISGKDEENTANEEQTPNGDKTHNEENTPNEENSLDDEDGHGEKNGENTSDKEDGSDVKNTHFTENPPESKSGNGNIPQKGLENGSEEFSTGVNKESNGNGGHVNEEQRVIENENATEFENPVEDVSGQLNSIINCLEATKFVQLDDPDRQFWQMFSLKENPAEALGSKQESAMKLVALTQRGLARVYPAGTRVDSSNYNPIPFWMRWVELSDSVPRCKLPNFRGFQMAALNLQTRDEGCQINSAFFEQNSGCGYVLKPVTI